MRLNLKASKQSSNEVTSLSNDPSPFSTAVPSAINYSN